jgi:inorganic pyrophosphatase
MHLENLSIGSDPPNEVNAVIEVPVGGEPIKYETDKAAGMLVVDRFLYTPMRYPGNYGFIPHALGGWRSLRCSRGKYTPADAGCAIAVRPVGVLKMVDESGGDEKIVAVPVSRLTQRYGRVHNYTDLPEILWRQIEHFFAHYKDLEPGKWSKFDGWGDAEHAKDLIEQAIARASKLQRVRERL